MNLKGYSLICLFFKFIYLAAPSKSSFIIDNYVKKEDFEGAAKYLNLKNKHIKE